MMRVRPYCILIALIWSMSFTLRIEKSEQIKTKKLKPKSFLPYFFSEERVMFYNNSTNPISRNFVVSAVLFLCFMMTYEIAYAFPSARCTAKIGTKEQSTESKELGCNSTLHDKIGDKEFSASAKYMKGIATCTATVNGNTLKDEHELECSANNDIATATVKLLKP